MDITETTIIHRSRIPINMVAWGFIAQGSDYRGTFE